MVKLFKKYYNLNNANMQPYYDRRRYTQKNSGYSHNNIMCFIIKHKSKNFYALGHKVIILVKYGQYEYNTYYLLLYCILNRS